MPYRNDLYHRDNIIGYTGSLNNNPTVYFDNPRTGEFGRITQNATILAETSCALPETTEFTRTERMELQLNTITEEYNIKAEIASIRLEEVTLKCNN